MAFGRSKGRHRAGGTTVTTTTTTVEHPAGENHGGRNRDTRALGTKPSLGQCLFGTRTRTPKVHHATTTPATTKRHRGVGARGTPATATASATPRRKTSMSDKVSEAMLKLNGSLSHRTGQKAAGTRRMHGTDGRGTRRYY